MRLALPNLLRLRRRRRLILCPGFRKAASTSHQAFLRQNQDALAPYARISARDELSERWRNRAMGHVQGDRVYSAESFATEAARMCRTLEKAGDDTVVIADENLIGNRLISSDGKTLFDWAAWLLPILEGAFEGKRVVEYVFLTREWEAWLRSCYAQAVRQQGETRDWETWYATLPSDMSWEQGEAQIRAAVKGSVTFIDLKDDAFGDSPGKTVLGRLGVPRRVRNTLTHTTRHYNVSPPEETLERRRARNARLAATGKTKKSASAGEASRRK